MGPRIEELAKQCWSHHVDGVLIDGHLHFDYKKFASLLIEEVEGYVEECEGDSDYILFLIAKHLKQSIQ